MNQSTSTSRTTSLALRGVQPLASQPSHLKVNALDKGYCKDGSPFICSDCLRCSPSFLVKGPRLGRGLIDGS